MIRLLNVGHGGSCDNLDSYVLLPVQVRPGCSQVDATMPAALCGKVAHTGVVPDQGRVTGLWVKNHDMPKHVCVLGLVQHAHGLYIQHACTTRMAPVCGSIAC